jgi:GAF domain-containing protein
MNERSPSQEVYNREFFSYEQWREGFLNNVLQAACVLGFIAVILYLFTPSTLVNKILAVIIYAILLLPTFLTKFPYGLRASVFLVILYSSGLTSLIDHGLADSSVLFLAFIVMTGLLFFPRLGVYVLIGIITLLSILIVGWNIAAPLDLIRLSVLFTVSVAIIVSGLHAFQDEFIGTQRTALRTLEIIRSEQSSLEQRVEERTAGLTRKTEQLRATSYIARQTAEVQDLSALLDLVAKLVTEQFGFYHTGLFLINETGEEAVLQAASSDGGQRMIERGHSLAIGKQGIVGYVAAEKKPRIALDVGVDPVFFNNPDLPMTRSELALPLLIRNKVLGILDIQSDKPQAFNVDDIDVLQTLADHVAVAIENARLFDESQATLTQLEALTTVRTREAWRQELHGKSRVFTYTPLGLRAEKLSRSGDNHITIPLTLRGQKIGSISVARKGDASIHKSDEELITEVANQAGLAIDNIRLLEEATQRARQEQIVGKLAGRFSQSLDIDTLLQTAVRELAQLPDVSEVSVVIGQQTSATPANQKNQRGTG